MEESKRSFLTLPGAIIIAATIIAISIIVVMRPAKQVDNSVSKEAKGNDINLSPITATDHILGNPDAKIKIVEYSDTECPYCKIFNSTLTEIMDTYGPNGKVAWVYRHYTLDKPDSNGNVLHKNSGYEAEAMECAALLGGNTKFWAYEKALYTATPSVTSKTPDGLDRKELPTIAKGIGLDVIAFNDCLSSGQFKEKIDQSFESAQAAQVNGTPTSFLVLDNTISEAAIDYISNTLIQYKIPESMLRVSADKKIILMSGALPKTMIVGLIETLIK